MKLLVAAVLAVSALSSGSVVQNPNDGTFELLILHNNDMHARFEQTSQLSGTCTTADREAGKCYGGFPRVAHVVKEARRAAKSGEGPPVLYLNAGDTYTGTAWFTLYKSKIAVEFVNALQPDAVSLGNHEFDLGIGGLTPFIENLTTPVLAANLDLAKVPELANESNLKKSVTLDVNGRKIGVIGYLTPETKLVAIANNVEYIDEIIALKEEVKKLQDEGVNIIIALGHSGFQKDRQIAKNVDGIDLVIGGHTNTFLWNGTSPDSEVPQGNYPTYVKQKSGKLVPVVQAYAYTKYLGRLHMIFDNNGELVSADGSPILLDKNIPQDKEVLKIMNKYRDNVLNTAGEVIGNSTVVLDGACLVRECNIGNLITDAMVFRYAMDYSGEHWTDAPIAIIQGGGVRSSVAHENMPMNITKGDLLEVMPFDGNMAAVTMNGTVLLRALEHSVANYDSIEHPGAFLQFSGLKVTYDLSKPAGSRVIKSEARCWACDVPKYFKIDNKEFYKVLMPSFLANGGDGFLMFQFLPTETLGYSELQATQYYVAHHSPIYPQVEGKITLLNEFNDNSLDDEPNACSFISSSKLVAFISVLTLTLL